MTEPAPHVAVVIVTFNTRALLDDCMRALLASTGVGLEVWVVDNASSDGSADHVAAAFPQVHLIRNAKNRGFAAANNLALCRTSAPLWLLLNPDTLVRPDTVVRLASGLLERDEVGICGPAVLNADQTLQSCGYRYPTLSREVRESNNVNRWLKRLVGDGQPDDPVDRPREVDWVSGCCFMIRRAVAEDVGLLDEQFFLYHEDLEWCRRSRRAGWRVMTVPDAVMTHLGAQSTQQVKPEALALSTETRLRFYRWHGGVVTAVTIAAVYALGYALRWHVDSEKSRARLVGIRRFLAALVRGEVAPRVPRLDPSAQAR